MDVVGSGLDFGESIVNVGEGVESVKYYRKNKDM